MNDDDTFEPMTVWVECYLHGNPRQVTVTHPSQEFYCRDCGDRMQGTIATHSDLTI
jgi:hypothetical protein